MKIKPCEACKQVGKTSSGHYLDTIYRNRGGEVMMRLCYSHSVELFKTGQTKFVGKYRPDERDAGLEDRPQSNPLQNYFIFNSFR